MVILGLTCVYVSVTGLTTSEPLKVTGSRTVLIVVEVVRKDLLNYYNV